MFNVVYIHYCTHMQSSVAYHLACSLAVLYTCCHSVTCALQCFPLCPRADLHSPPLSFFTLHVMQHICFEAVWSCWRCSSGCWLQLICCALAQVQSGISEVQSGQRRGQGTEGWSDDKKPSFEC
ncbi:hypothetical protein PAXRUDRAFT_596716 [Paxillus rubicundulus Ve08.2h10]|uniref:Uncharacterized protein n=1 Tax=Paxillus rubicundulus Ve08.2h10 TaxID=930991 RepID=A0A0D0DTR4_9AGAM|nr:hypothetical protein PAXRUDRAFT_596716 [Paxillus rubicundulus Ve08.2h10]